MMPPDTNGHTRVVVCARCEQADHPGAPSIAHFIAHLRALLAHEASIRVEAADCLAVCSKACTLAFVADGKWTYLVGGIDTQHDASDVAQAALTFARSPHGILPLEARPPFFRNGVLGRIPPAGFGETR